MQEHHHFVTSSSLSSSIIVWFFVYHVWVEMSSSSLAGVASVSSHVDVEAVQTWLQTIDLTPDVDPIRDPLQNNGASNVGATWDQLNIWNIFESKILKYFLVSTDQQWLVVVLWEILLDQSIQDKELRWWPQNWPELATDIVWNMNITNQNMGLGFHIEAFLGKCQLPVKLHDSTIHYFLFVAAVVHNVVEMLSVVVTSLCCWWCCCADGWVITEMMITSDFRTNNAFIMMSWEVSPTIISS